jgi:hypothetical protein
MRSLGLNVELKNDEDDNDAQGDDFAEAAE